MQRPLRTAFGCCFALSLSCVPHSAFAELGTEIEIAHEPDVTAAELAPYRQPGTAKIRGRFNLVMNGTTGRLEYANVDVYAMPAVPWGYWYAHEATYEAANERFDFDAVLGTDNPLGDLMRHDTTDRSGSFEFDGLPQGKWIVVSRVKASIDSQHTMEHEDEFYRYYRTTTTTCHPVAALEAVVTVGAGQTVTTPIGITGWRYDRKC